MLRKCVLFSWRSLRSTATFQTVKTPFFQAMRFSSDSSPTESPPGGQGRQKIWGKSAPIFEPPLRPLVKPISKPVTEISKQDLAFLEGIMGEDLDPEGVAEILAEEDITLHELKMMIGCNAHLYEDDELIDEDGPFLPPPGDVDPNEEEWNPSMIEDINPRARFAYGVPYDPKVLSPLTKPEKTRRGNFKKGCPLGGKKGPKIDFANVELLSRFLTDGGRILGRRKTGTCAKKQRELSRAIKRARVINLLPYMHKPREYMRKDSVEPNLDSL